MATYRSIKSLDTHNPDLCKIMGQFLADIPDGLGQATNTLIFVETIDGKIVVTLNNSIQNTDLLTYYDIEQVV